ncbi:MAG: rRNA maturation RNase YbeY [Mariprofundales bacterium]
MTIDILYDQPWDSTPPQAAMEQAIVATLPDGRGDLCLRLADNDAVQQLNTQWRNIDRVTDVLSFPMQVGAINPNQPLGDIILAVPFVQQEAQRLGIACHAHCIHLLIHGTLHLLGFDHAEAEEEQTMRQRERQIMQQLQLHNPWPN